MWRVLFKIKDVKIFPSSHYSSDNIVYYFGRTLMDLANRKLNFNLIHVHKNQFLHPLLHFSFLVHNNIIDNNNSKPLSNLGAGPGKARGSIPQISTECVPRSSLRPGLVLLLTCSNTIRDPSSNNNNKDGLTKSPLQIGLHFRPRGFGSFYNLCIYLVPLHPPPPVESTNICPHVFTPIMLLGPLQSPVIIIIIIIVISEKKTAL